MNLAPSAGLLLALIAAPAYRAFAMGCTKQTYTSMKGCEAKPAGSHVVTNPDGTQTTVQDNDLSECRGLAADVADDCSDAYDKALEVLKTAKTEAEIADTEKRLSEITEIVKDVKTITGVTSDPSLKDLADLDTSVIPDAVNEAKQRLKAVGNKAGDGKTDAVTAAGAEVVPPVAQARELLNQGNHEAGMEKLDGLIGPGTQDPDLFSMRSWALAKSGDEEAALRDAVMALELDPENELAGQVKAYLESKSKVGNSKVELKPPDFSGLASGGGGPAAEWAKAGEAPSGGEWMWGKGGAGAGPQAASGGAAAASPSPAQAILKSSMEKFRVGDLNGALLDATRALQSDKSDMRARAIRAAVSNRQKNHEGALWEAGEMLKLHPNNVPAHMEKALAEYGLLQYDAALTDARTAIRLDPGNALAQVYQGMILEKMGKKEEAFLSYEKAAGLDPAMGRFLEDARGRAGSGKTDKGLDWKMLARWGGPIGAALIFLIGAAWMKTSGRPDSVPAAAESATLRQAGAATVAGATVLQTSAATVPQAAGAAGPGSLLAGTYRLGRELGKGGMGVVYEALDEKLQRPVALKRLKREAYDSPELKERFLKEARMVAKLRHPNLAEIFTVVGEEDLYLVFELVQGEALDKTLSRRGRLSLDEAKKIVAEVCAALEYAHNEHVIHRDMKPSNVMFDKNGMAKVMDFGIAHESHGGKDMTQTAAWGTPPYMAPEQEGGRVGRESDLYALAVMAYEMVAGSRPFPGPYFLEKKLKKQYPPATAVNGTLPKSLDGFFSKALEPEPEKRFRTAAEFAREFQRLA
ncbi:MAG: protein kinase [Elusimicrobia bacterium]|nr:protein kinase [Elusimicrobiota bacterium]